MKTVFVRVKRRTFLGWGVAVAAVGVFGHRQQAIAQSSPPPQQITVNTVEGFLEALGSNRTILLESGSYNLTDIDPNLASDFVFIEDVHDGKQVTLSGVENLTIRGVGASPPRLLVRPRYASVLPINTSRNLILENLELGHFPEAGYCTGNVLDLYQCQNVRVLNNHWFGSGAWGIQTNACSDVEVRNTQIRHCTYGAAIAINSESVRFVGCELGYNRQFSIISAINSPNMAFVRCNFHDNLVSSDESPFFETRDRTSITIAESRFENNQASRLVLDTAEISIRETQFVNNTFRDRG